MLKCFLHSDNPPLRTDTSGSRSTAPLIPPKTEGRETPRRKTIAELVEEELKEINDVEELKLLVEVTSGGIDPDLHRAATMKLKTAASSLDQIGRNNASSISNSYSEEMGSARASSAAEQELGVLETLMQYRLSPH